MTPAAFIVLSGPLGSGKTTLVEDFLAAGDDGRTAVIVNDIGEVNIDGAIIAAQSGVPMATLSNGCVCCSLTNDLLYTIEAMLAARRLSGAQPFSRIILECSGISHPGAVMRSLGELSPLGMQVRVLTTYPCDRQLNDEAADFDVVAGQLAAAHGIVLTRMDLASVHEIDCAARIARAVGPFATLLSEPDRSARARLALGMLPAASRPFAAAVPAGSDEGHRRIQVFALSFGAAVAWPTLAAWLENLAGYLDERLLRVKGCVRVGGCDQPLLIQGVGQHFDTPRRMEVSDMASKLIVITRDAAIEEITEMTPLLRDCRISMVRAPVQAARPAGVQLARPAA